MTLEDQLHHVLKTTPGKEEAEAGIQRKDTISK